MEPLLHPVTARQLAGLRPGAASAIFVGPVGLGRTTAAIALAQRLNCPAGGGDDCQSCRSLAGGNHPDLIMIQATTPSLGVEVVKGLQEQLMVQPYYEASQRVVVIEPAERLTLEAQNRLLKTLEEPPPRTLIILITTTAEALTTTIRSRCEQVRFVVPTAPEIKDWLAESGASADRVAEIERLRLNRPARIARLLSDPEALEGHRQLSQLAAQVLAGSLYDRLLLVPSLLAQGLGATELTSALRRQITAAAPAAVELLRSLEALGRYHRRLASNVGAKLALEGLVLEL